MMYSWIFLVAATSVMFVCDIEGYLFPPGFGIDPADPLKEKEYNNKVCDSPSNHFCSSFSLKQVQDICGATYKGATYNKVTPQCDAGGCRVDVLSTNPNYQAQVACGNLKTPGKSSCACIQLHKV